MYRGPQRNTRLIANREGRLSHKNRLRNSAFGAFRAVSGESQAHLQSALILARHDVREYFNWQTNKYTELLIPAKHGVTYVKRNHVVQALGSSSMVHFNFPRFQEDVEGYNRSMQGLVGLPLGQLDWHGPGELKLVAKIPELQGHEIGDYQDIIEKDSSSLARMLGRAGARAIDVLEPDHLTLCQFRRSRQREHQLTLDQKYDIADIVQARLEGLGIRAVALGEMALERPRNGQPVPVLA
jgi:hypothetical protein